MIKSNLTTFRLMNLSLGLSFLLLTFINPASAVQPMTENDLEVVSATTGSNILNIFGNSKAGLKVDTDGTQSSESSSNLATEQFKEGEATKPIALNQIRTIEEDALTQPSTSNNEATISSNTQSTILKLSEQTTGNASVFSTDSEIKYKTSNVHHEMRLLDNDAVAVTRDLQIDQLRIENLRGDSAEDGRSAGSIYLSDWRSQGDTRIFNNR